MVRKCIEKWTVNIEKTFRGNWFINVWTAVCERPLKKCIDLWTMEYEGGKHYDMGLSQNINRTANYSR